jgi:recombination protein RecR
VFLDEKAGPLERLVHELCRLPGIGPKTGQRLAFHLLRVSQQEAEALAEAILDIKTKLVSCSVCNNIGETDPCSFCSDPRRNSKLLCIVEEPHDVPAVEKTGEFRGRYHVLMGVLSPIKGIGPDELKIESLLERVRDGEFEEVIVATNPTVEGETTAVYLARILKPLGPRVTRIALGLPVGGDLDFADEVTMTRALEGRREL